VATSLTLFNYMTRVEYEAGLKVSSSFPTSATDEQQHVIDCISATLREINNHYYLAFKQTEYTLTTSAGTNGYDLTQAPYSQTDWEVSRIAKPGVIRVTDDYPLQYIDWEDYYHLAPNLGGNTKSVYYTAYGKKLYFNPTPDGSQYKIFYYGTHIGTDSTGVTKKWRLTATGDLTMLEDRWEDALVYGAAAKVRRQRAVDEKYQTMKGLWEEWRTSLVDMMQPGEEAAPELVIPKFRPNFIDRRIGNFFDPNIGG